MAMWLFRRNKSRRKARASTTDFEDARGREAGQALPPRSQTLQDVMAPVPDLDRRQSTRKSKPEPNKLQRRQRTYSFSPGRNDTIGVGRRNSVRDKRGTLPPMVTHPDPGSRRTRDRGSLNKEIGLDWYDSLRRGHNKREGDHLPRKLSSKKRRKNDPQREAEIKAMSNFMPLRSATEDWASHPLRGNSRRARTGFSSGFTGRTRQEWEKYNRSSEISLPADSIHSNHSSDSEYISFRVSALDALAPRPTLRRTTNPRPIALGTEGGPGLGRTLSRQQGKLSEPIPEATLKAHKRIHDLADELSASDLRELMERDTRRRERRRQREEEKLQQRLARRAEKQRAAEVVAQEEGRDTPPNLERGVLGRELVGLGVEPTSAVITSSRIRRSDESLEQRGQDDQDSGPGDDQRPHPLEAFHRTDSIPLQSPELPSPSPIEAKPPQPQAPHLTSPRSRTSFIRLKLSRSKSPLESDGKTDKSEPAQIGSETSSSKAPLSWSSLFRWGRNKRSSGQPSSFSNTSRDSMQPSQQIPTPPVNFVPRRVSSGVPKRTMSRFREDLPELPLSPPDSRIQSPEAELIPRTIAESSPDPGAVTEHVVFAPPSRTDTYDTPTSEQRSMEAMRHTPSTFGHPDEPSVSPELQTMSLASIDSEGSWLSGRLSKKRKPSGNLQSAPYGRLRRTSDSDTEHHREHDNQGEDMSITEDDYLARFAHSNSERPGWNRKSVGEPRPSSDGEEETHWGSVRGHQPFVVHSHTADRVKSREGLLNSFGEEGEIGVVVSGDPDNDSGEDDGEGSGLQRATSINLGKDHVRHISAGSARLLSISPRSSVDTKRLSLPRSQGKNESSQSLA